MRNTLLDEFEKYETIENSKEELKDIGNLSPTIILPLICSKKLKIENVDSIRKIEPQKGYFEDEQEILNELDIPPYNKNTLNFIFHELTSNIYDHSKFSNGLVMGKSYMDFKEIGFMDDGITIPTSLRDGNYSFENDCKAIIEAINGLSTKNELGFIERGTGLNNTINIIVNGCNGSALICSGGGLVLICQNEVHLKDISETPINGTLISLRMDLKEKVDIYNYLNHVHYKY